jgi:hypothetical protein
VNATGDDGDKQVDATGDNCDEQVDATGDDGDEQVDATGDDGDEQVDATGDDGDEQADATGNDGDEQVDATGDDNVGNDGDNRFVCTSVNHRGPCGWKIAHQCICKDHDVPFQCKENLNESCLRLIVHPECMWLWERSSSAITPVDALLQFNLVCPMHHPHYKKPYMSDMPYLKQRNHPSPMNRQTFTQPPTSKETTKPNEKSSSSGPSTDSSPSDSSTSSSNSNSDCSQSIKYKRSGKAELIPKNKDSSPMIKGMDIMASESAKFAFERDKHKYSSSEHLERYRQIQISCGMDPTYAVPSANCSDSGSSSSSSISSGSSLSSSAVGTDTSNKTPVATIVHGDDGDQECDFVDNGHFVGNDDDDKGKHGNEGNDSEDGHEDDEDNKNGDGCDDATNNVILDCAAGTQCKAPSGANLTDSPHLCWGCNKRNNKSRQIDYWFFRGVGVNGVWPSLYDVVVPWLRLPIPINSIPHPYWMYTKCFSTLRYCGWAYECILML